MSNNLLNNTASLQNILEALQNKATPSGGTMLTATITLTGSLLSSYPKNTVCYMGTAGVQKSTWDGSPFVCVVPSIMFIDDGNADILYDGNVSELYNGSLGGLVVNIAGDGTVSLNSSLNSN